MVEKNKRGQSRLVLRGVIAGPKVLRLRFVVVVAVFSKQNDILFLNCFVFLPIKKIKKICYIFLVKVATSYISVDVGFFFLGKVFLLSPLHFENVLSNLNKSLIIYQDIVWHGFKESCTAKMIQQTSTSSPHSGMKKGTYYYLNNIFKQLDCYCFLFPLWNKDWMMFWKGIS